MTARFLPNLFILGAAKCGTTTLHTYLGELPDVCMADPKEPFFFEAEFDQGLDFYQRKYFSHWQGEPVIGEARHRNLYLPYVPQRIYQVNPNAKLIVLARDPVERAFSHWYHNFVRDSEELKFVDALHEDLKRIERGLCCDTPGEIKQHIANLPREAPGKVLGLGLYRTYLDSGYYYEQIVRYLNLFPRDSLRVFLFEDLIARPAQIIDEIIAFLDLDPNVNKFTGMIWKNPRKHLIDKSSPYYGIFRSVKYISRRLNVLHLLPKRMRKFGRNLLLPTQKVPKMDRRTRNWLSEHYYEHNQKLSKFLGRDLSEWQ